MRIRTGKRRRLVAGAASVALALGLMVAVAAPAAADTDPVSGTISTGCTYAGSVDTSALTVDITVGGGAGDNCAGAQLSGEISGDIEDGETTDSVISFDDIQNITATLEGQDLGPYTVPIGFSVDTGVDLATPGNIANGISNVISEVEQYVASRLLETITQSGLGDLLGEDLQAPYDDLMSGEQSYCSSFDDVVLEAPEPGNHTNDMCTPPNCVGNPPEPTPCPNFGAKISDDSSESPSSDSDQQSLCPILNAMQDDTLYVCLPDWVAGNLDAGNRTIVLLPGALLTVLPIGGSGDQLTSTPTISSNTGIISLGGVVTGYNLTLKAPKIAIAAGLVNMLHNLTIDGSTSVSLGSVDIDDIVSDGLADEVGQQDENDWGKSLSSDDNPLGEVVPTSGTVSAGADLSGANISIATKALSETSSSTLSADALGGQGQLTDDLASITGENNNQGGSHGGYGGIEWSSFAADDNGDGYAMWHSKWGRAPAYDSPFAPGKPGDGGGGDPIGASGDEGLPGGGVIRINTSQGSSDLDGIVTADGSDTGVCGGCGDHGGSGAGGSIYLTSKSLAGTGVIRADGGGMCAAVDCTDDDEGGSGGGGRVAVVTTSSSFTGAVHANGGYDHQISGTLDTSNNTGEGTGGAGTVFLRSATFKSNGQVDKGTGVFPDGTLVVTGGRPDGYYPPPDGTPISSSWNDKHRQLVLDGEARGYGTSLSFGKIVVAGDSTLTTNPFASGASKFSVAATSLEVDKGSQITMESRGYAGGKIQDGSGAAPKGKRPASGGYGGSHGGVGGIIDSFGGAVPPGSKTGATYDSASKPVDPGAGGGASEDYEGSPGGGVLDVSAGNLTLNGTLSADGVSGEGPTAYDPTPVFRLDSGAGAGGSVFVEAAGISGTGAITASGGIACPTGAPAIDTGAALCTADSPAGGGGGGGGRIAVAATTDCTWTGDEVVNGGINESTVPGSAGFKQTAAHGGSIYFPSAKHNCGKDVLLTITRKSPQKHTAPIRYIATCHFVACTLTGTLTLQINGRKAASRTVHALALRKNHVKGLQFGLRLWESEIAKALHKHLAVKLVLAASAHDVHHHFWNKTSTVTIK